MSQLGATTRRVKRVLGKARRLLTRPVGLRLEDVGPVSRNFGYDRGTPIDRYYIERFLDRHRSWIHGRVLEVEDSTYSRRFAGEDAAFEVLHVDPQHRGATLVGDLTVPDSLPERRFDCFICTQTLNFIFDVQKAVEGTYRVLKPGGVLLGTVSGISQGSATDRDEWGDYWRFTPQSVLRMLEPVFGAGNVQVESYGNCFAAVNLLRGVAVEEVVAAHLEPRDEDYPVTIAFLAHRTSDSFGADPGSTHPH